MLLLMAGVIQGLMAVVEMPASRRRSAAVAAIVASGVGLWILGGDIQARVGVARAVDFLNRLPPDGSPSVPREPRGADENAFPLVRSPRSPAGEFLREFLQKKGSEPAKPEGAAVTVMEAENFRFTPPSGWSSFDAKQLNPNACYAVRNWSLQATGLVIAEAAPQELMPSLDQIAEQSRVGFSRVGKVRILSSQKVEKQGVPGLRVDLALEYGLSGERCVQFVFAHRGYCWQMMTFGPLRNGEKIAASAEQLLQGFEIIDLNRVGALAPDSLRDPRYTSPHGWSVDLSGEKEVRWVAKWPALEKDLPAAEFGIIDDTGRYSFLVVQHWLPDASVSEEVLAEAMMAHFNFRLVQSLRREPCRQGPARGLEMEFMHKVDGQNFLCQVRVLRHEKRVWMIAAFRPETATTTKMAITRSLDAVRIDEQAPAPPAGIPDKHRHNLGLICTSMAAACRNKSDLDGAFLWSRHALQAESKEPMLVENFIEDADQSNREKEAIALVESGGISFSTADAQKACLISLRFKSGEFEWAAREADSLFQGGYRDDGLVSQYIAALTAEKKHARALEVFESYMGNKRQSFQRRFQGTLLYLNGQKDEALTVIREALRDEPDPMTALRLVQYLSAENRHEEAITAAREYAAKHSATVSLLQVQAESEAALKRYREAKVTLETALKLSPSDETTKVYLRDVSAMLGEGDNSQIKTPLEPVAIDPALLIPPKGDHTAYLAGYNAHFLLKVRATEILPVESRFKMRTTEYHSFHVADAQAAEHFNTLRVPFHPRGESVYLNRLVVKNAEGKEVGTGRVEDCYVLDEGDDGLATDRRTIHIPVPGLKPGCTVEYQYTREEETADGEPPFDTMVFAQAYPVLRSIFSLKAPKGLLSTEASPSLQKKVEGGITFWSINKPEPLRFEPRMAPFHTFVPQVSFGDPAARWPKLAQLYLAQIHERLAVNAEIEATARNLTAQLKTDDEKITVLARHVREELTYKGIEFGRRARVPQTVGEIVRNRYGDCKDHSLLLYHLLRGAGIKADLALIHSSGAITPNLPSLDQFDHMIVYVPKVSRFLDCTSKSSDLQGPPLGLGGCQALLLDAEYPALLAVPKPKESTVVIAQEAETSGENSVQISETVEIDGDFAAGMRSFLRDAQPAHRREMLQQYLQGFEPGLDLRTVEFERLEACESSLRIKMEALVPRKTRLIGGRLLLDIPSPWEQGFITASPVDKRTTPFRVVTPVKVEISTKLKLPSGWHYTAGAVVDKKREFVGCSMRCKVVDSAVQIQRTLHLQAGHFPAGKYADMVRELAECKSIMGAELLLEKAGAR